MVTHTKEHPWKNLALFLFGSEKNRFCSFFDYIKGWMKILNRHEKLTSNRNCWKGGRYCAEAVASSGHTKLTQRQTQSRWEKRMTIKPVFRRPPDLSTFLLLVSFSCPILNSGNLLLSSVGATVLSLIVTCLVENCIGRGGPLQQN